MSRLLRAAMLLALIAVARPALASAVAGGACPSAATYINSSTGATGVTLASLGVTSCFYVAANGSDSNNGISESTPWLHAPGMPNCTGTCASTTPAAGNGFIFRGGDTWHFGNSSASPYTGGYWAWPNGGTSSNPVYVGIDLSWFSGASWARPILNGDNPLTPNPGVVGDFVASCAFQVSGNNRFATFTHVPGVIFDYFEFTGLCQSDSGQPNSHDSYLDSFNGSATTANWIERIYMHGWTHTNYANCGGGSVCANIQLLSIGDATAYRYIVVDGSDSDPGASLTFTAGSAMYDIAYSVFRYTAQMIGNKCHLFHDNLVEHWATTVHPNVFECVGEPDNSPGAFYNNVFRHLCTDSGLCPLNPVGIWPEPKSTTGDYWFNNVMYDISPSVEYFNVGDNGANQGPLIIFNNTMENVSPPIFGCVSSHAAPITFANNHFIIDASPFNGNCAAQMTASPLTELQMTHTTATADGYTSSETFAYFPTTGSSPTVGAGTNEANNFCATILAVSDPQLQAAGAACKLDTTFGVSYNSADHTAVFPARTPTARPAGWDAGSYQFSSSQQSSAPNPPTNLTAAVQ